MQGEKIRKVFLITILSLAITSFYWSLVQAQETKVMIVRLKGTVLVQSDNGSWEPARKWMQLPVGSYLKTTCGSSLDLMFNKKALIRVKGESEFYLGQVIKGIKNALEKAHPGFCNKDRCQKGTVIRLIKGKAFFYVTPGFSGLPFIVDTPLGIAGVTGTRFAVEIANKKQLVVAVYQGRVVVWPRYTFEKFVVVEAGFVTRVMAGKPPQAPSPMSDEERKRYKECLKLHFGLRKSRAFIETSSRYRGVFSRGYSPEVLSEFGPTRTYQQYQYQGGSNPPGGNGYVNKTVHGSDKKNASLSKKENANIDNRHTSMTNSHNKMEHHDMTDNRHSIKDHTMTDHTPIDKRSTSVSRSMTDHSITGGSSASSAPSRHNTSTPRPPSSTSSTKVSHPVTTPVKAPSTSSRPVSGHNK